MVRALSGALSQSVKSARGVRIRYFSKSEAIAVEILTGLVSEGWQTIATHIGITKLGLEILIADLNLRKEFVASNRFIRIDPFFVICTNGTRLLTAHLLANAFAKEGILFRLEKNSNVSGLETDTRFYPFTSSLDDWKWKLKRARTKS